MSFKPLDVASVLDQLEAFYGPQKPGWPVEPYQFLIWWHCGYPASDAACGRGWTALQGRIGIEPDQILAAPSAEISRALAAGGMVPELRALRIQQIAERVLKEFDGDLRNARKGELGEIRKRLKRFPGIADPGVDRILLFGKWKAVAAVPSNCPQVLVRIELGLERHNYGVNYREAQSLIAGAIEERFSPRMRAYLLLKEHGQSLCKRTQPKCDQCPIRGNCAYFAERDRGRSRPEGNSRQSTTARREV